MSRKEDFKKAADDYVEGEPDGAQKIVGQVGFEFGAEYGYQYAIDKACEWLKENIYHRVYECGDRLGYPTADFLKDFRKAMGE